MLQILLLLLLLLLLLVELVKVVKLRIYSLLQIFDEVIIIILSLTIYLLLNIEHLVLGLLHLEGTFWSFDRIVLVRDVPLFPDIQVLALYGVVDLRLASLLHLLSEEIVLVEPHELVVLDEVYISARPLLVLLLEGTFDVRSPDRLFLGELVLLHRDLLLCRPHGWSIRLRHQRLFLRGLVLFLVDLVEESQRRFVVLLESELVLVLVGLLVLHLGVRLRQLRLEVTLSVLLQFILVILNVQVSGLVDKLIRDLVLSLRLQGLGLGVVPQRLLLGQQSVLLVLLAQVIFVSYGLILGELMSSNLGLIGVRVSKLVHLLVLLVQFLFGILGLNIGGVQERVIADEG